MASAEAAVPVPVIGPASYPTGPMARPGPLPRLGTAALPLLLVLGLVALAPSSAAAQGDDDSAALALLQRAIIAASEISYRGLQVDATWTDSGMTTRMIDVRQAGGLRAMTVRGTGGTASTRMSVPVRPAGHGADPLTLLAGAFAVSLAGKDQVASRSASVVVALREGRVAARLWLDDGCGLQLRQEVWDSHGRLIRMISFIQLEELVADRDTTAAAQADDRGSGGADGTGSGMVGGNTGTAGRDSGTAGRDSGTAGRKRGRLAAAEVAGGDGAGGNGAGGVRGGADAAPADPDPQAEARRLQSPCPTALPGGFRLVDAREGTPSAGGTPSAAVHLTYSNGLSAMSVFFQDGRLPEAGVTGMSPQDWGGLRVYVGKGWPIRAVWQGGGQVFTIISDASADEVAAASGVLPGDRAPSGVFDRIAAFVNGAAVLVPGR
jgi:sigma-E factor negative regulatory protein RseB